MKHSKFLKILVSGILLFLLGLFSCKTSTQPNDPEPVTYPDSGLSYSQHIRPIFLQDCASAGSCHQSGVRAGGLDLEADPPSFQSNYGLVVIPGRSDLSLLYILLFQEVPNVARRMPPPDFSGPLTQGETDAIGTWIDEGANTAN